MDFNFWVRVGRGCRIEYLPGMVARFRSHSAAKSNARARDFLQEILFTLDWIFSDPYLPQDVVQLRREAYSGAYLSGGIRSYNVGEWSEARKLLIKGLCYYPHPFRLRTIKAAILLTDTLIGSNLGKLLKSFRRRLDHVRFR